MKLTDWLMAFLTAIYVGISYFGLRAIKVQTKIAKDSADAAKQAAEAASSNAQTIVNVERPFILVEIRDKTQFWMRNCGKSPAQILHVDPVMKQAWPKFDSTAQDYPLPDPPTYGQNYAMGEQFNIAWVAPGEERCFTTFSPDLFADLGDEKRAELNQGIRRFYIYSSIKYRGILSKDVYESRFCYSWGQHGLYMSGPYGYNKNT